MSEDHELDTIPAEKVAAAFEKIKDGLTAEMKLMPLHPDEKRRILRVVEQQHRELGIGGDA